MKRGFLNTPKAKKAVEDAYAPWPSPSTKSPPRSTQDGGQETPAAAEDAMDVDVPVVGDASDAGNRVTAVRKAEPSVRGDNDTELEPSSKDAKGKGKEKAVDADSDDAMDASADSNETLLLPPRPPPRRPGWGRDPKEDFFHRVPKSHGGPHQKRAVFRLWPRDRQGKTLTKGPNGTLSPDGYPWGETLYDFFSVSRVPQLPFGVATFTTGSALLQKMEELGELEAAAPEIEWARTEGKPRDVGVADTVVLIESIERRSQLMVYFNFSMREEVRRMAPPLRTDRDSEESVEQAEQDGKGEEEGQQRDEEQKMEDVVEEAPKDDDDDGKDSNNEDNDEGSDDEEEGDDEEQEAPEHDDRESYIEYNDTEVDPATVPPPPTIPVTSPFHPSHYPIPWPFIPFANPLSILLQERIPLYQLPQTLYVHDPFRLLSALEKRFRDNSWLSRPDIVHTYNLKLSETVRDQVAGARRKAEELEEFKARTLIILRYKRTKEQIKNHEPMIEVPLPPYSRRLTTVQESHLYLSPVAKVGKGHHSVVYKGEWELPRDLFVRPKLCRLCFEESARKEIQRLKDTGRWDKMLKAASWGPTGYTGREPTQAELDEVSDPVNLEMNGEIIEREITCIVPPNAPPSRIRQLLDETNIWDEFLKQGNATGATLDFAGDNDEGDSLAATIRINPSFSHESQRMCAHGQRSHPVPRTARFTVVAKLSIEDDPHLRREARNYQNFPECFFHHYNGYTIIKQLHSIVPVNAVVPQFYGYYTPKEGQNQRGEVYLSPILLLEHCGVPIDPGKLSQEDQEECASLLLRFQRAGWLHESVAERNFLVQYGKPTEFPLTREGDPEPSFRLIDFGRSRKYDNLDEKREEEVEALKMFYRLNGKMGVSYLAPA